MDYFQVRRLAIKLLGGKCSDGRYCSQCAAFDEDLITIDHINGDGQHGRPPSKRAKELLDAIENYNLQDRFQLFCFNCHWKKTIKNRELKSKQKTPQRLLGSSAGEPPLLELMTA